MTSSGFESRSQTSWTRKRQTHLPALGQNLSFTGDHLARRRGLSIKGKRRFTAPGDQSQAQQSHGLVVLPRHKLPAREQDPERSTGLPSANCQSSLKLFYELGLFRRWWAALNFHWLRIKRRGWSGSTKDLNLKFKKKKSSRSGELVDFLFSCQGGLCHLSLAFWKSF